MNEKYNQPTAHMLQPVKGWDSMAHLDFVAPIAKTVSGALPGTVMHLNTYGELETGLTAQGMGMFLFYKQTDEDVQPYPLTADGTQMTAVGMQSFGGYNSEMYLRTWPNNDPYNTNGTASNVQAYKFNENTGEQLTASYVPGKAAHTTYPAICGMELSSTEFASVMGDGLTGIQYQPNDTLTAPLPAAFNTTNAGTVDQQLSGGFLKKGACYVDPICGIVSKKPVINEHGYKQICFWATWLPALAANVADLAANSELKVVAGTDGRKFDLVWSDGSQDDSVFGNAKVTMTKDEVSTVLTAAATASAVIGGAFAAKFDFSENATGRRVEITAVTAQYDGAEDAGVTVTANSNIYPYSYTVNVASDIVKTGKAVTVYASGKLDGAAFTNVLIATFTAP